MDIYRKVIGKNCDSDHHDFGELSLEVKLIPVGYCHEDKEYYVVQMTKICSVHAYYSKLSTSTHDYGGVTYDESDFLKSVAGDKIAKTIFHRGCRGEVKEGTKFVKK